MVDSVKSVLMQRDRISEAEADERIGEFKHDLENALEIGDYEAAEDLVLEHFGLEPDYLMEFLV